MTDAQVEVLMRLPQAHFLAVDQEDAEIIQACNTLFEQGLLCRDKDAKDYTLTAAGAEVARLLHSKCQWRGECPGR